MFVYVCVCRIYIYISKTPFFKNDWKKGKHSNELRHKWKMLKKNWNHDWMEDTNKLLLQLRKKKPEKPLFMWIKRKRNYLWISPGSYDISREKNGLQWHFNGTLMQTKEKKNKLSFVFFHHLPEKFFYRTHQRYTFSPISFFIARSLIWHHPSTIFQFHHSCLGKYAVYAHSLFCVSFFSIISRFVSI